MPYHTMKPIGIATIKQPASDSLLIALSTEDSLRLSLVVLMLVLPAMLDVMG